MGVEEDNFRHFSGFPAVYRQAETRPNGHLSRISLSREKKERNKRGEREEKERRKRGERDLKRTEA